MTYVGIVLLLAVCVLLYLMRRDTFRMGKSEEQQKAAKEAIKEYEKVKMAREIAAHDPVSAAARKLRSKYTRRK